MSATELIAKEIAQQKVERFVRKFGEPHKLLAYHAALPLLLTPELLNYLRTEFLYGQVDWVAEVDLLLSPLCVPVGHELYAMDT
ncbi:MAG: formylglycine-generating enzyme family protein, partial [Pseudanabaena sp.]